MLGHLGWKCFGPHFMIRRHVIERSAEDECHRYFGSAFFFSLLD
ncbi:hypothetical protein NC651_017884 [Populus alba x Populus x berolinensis]|nr:hypothetical protein NC651_017884 [Populus alba x Populus x berolinensis]